MMTKPGITELDRCVDSRYTLVSMVAKRARMIGTERNKIFSEEREYDAKIEKPVSQAVEEIANGVVGYVRSEAIEKAREYEEEKFEAISNFEQKMVAESEKPADSESVQEADNSFAISEDDELKKINEELAARAAQSVSNV